MQHIYSHSEDDGTETLTLYTDQGSYVSSVTDTHINWKQIREALDSGAPDDEIRALLNPVDPIAEKLVRYAPKFSYINGLLTYDNRIVDGLPAKQILRLLTADDLPDEVDVRAVANCVAKLLDNPSAHSYENLLSWLQDRNLTILPNGDFLAYKGVDRHEDGICYSCHASPRDNMVKVNGEWQPAGHVPNPLGGVVEMERRLVDDDNQQGCSSGLHVGTYDYAKGYGNGALLKVAVNPADVVSVPTDSNHAKMRVCRYRVLETTDYEITELVHRSDYCCDWCDDDECTCDRCDECGEPDCDGECQECEHCGDRDCDGDCRCEYCDEVGCEGECRECEHCGDVDCEGECQECEHCGDVDCDGECQDKCDCPYWRVCPKCEND
jgi:hypothetical protein